MKLAILFLACCGFYLLANANLAYEELKPWLKNECPVIYINRYAKMLIDDGLYKPKKKKKLLKALGNRWCPEPSIDNGNVELTCGRGFAQTAKYTCNVGYQLTPKTSEERLCLGNRTWSGEAPECVPDCGPLPQVVNGCLTQTDTLEGSVAQYKCNPTHILTAGSAERTCLSNRTYSGDAATCAPVNCPMLSSPMHGSVSQSESTVGSLAQYSCQDGYQLQGPTARFCTNNGSWTQSEPTCLKIDCPMLSSPMHGSVSQSESTVGSLAQYSCQVGYQLQGPTTRFCTNNGSWTQSEPTCVKIDIPCINDLTSPYTGNVNITRSGIPCQRWADQYPHRHGVTDGQLPDGGGVSGADNYCRDPHGDGMPWCYTTLPAIRWEYCGIPLCNYDCWYKGRPRLYYGRKSTTKSNRTCQAWSAQSPHRHTNAVKSRFPIDLGVAAAQNFCRDPDKTGAPWCYTTDPNVRWEFCDIEFC